MSSRDPRWEVPEQDEDLWDCGVRYEDQPRCAKHFALSPGMQAYQGKACHRWRTVVEPFRALAIELGNKAEAGRRLGISPNTVSKSEGAVAARRRRFNGCTCDEVFLAARVT